MSYTSGGVRVITSSENQELLNDVRRQEDKYHPSFKLLDPDVGFRLKQVTIDVETPCHVRVNGSSPIYVKDYYSNQEVESIIIEESGIEVIMAYIY